MRPRYQFEPEARLEGFTEGDRGVAIHEDNLPVLEDWLEEAGLTPLGSVGHPLGWWQPRNWTRTGRISDLRLEWGQSGKWDSSPPKYGHVAPEWWRRHKEVFNSYEGIHQPLLIAYVSLVPIPRDYDRTIYIADLPPRTERSRHVEDQYNDDALRRFQAEGRTLAWQSFNTIAVAVERGLDIQDQVEARQLPLGQYHPRRRR